MRRILCICCAVALFGLSFAVPALAFEPVIELNPIDYEWTLAGEFDAQYYVDNMYPGYFTVNDAGYCVLRSDVSVPGGIWPHAFRAVSDYNGAGKPFRVVIEALDNTVINVRDDNYSAGGVSRQSTFYGFLDGCFSADYVSFKVTANTGVKSVKYYTGVKKVFGQGGISNTPSDLKYAAGFLSDVWDDLWNAVSSSWWLMSFIVLGLAGCLITIIANLVTSFQPRYKDGVKVWGLAGALRRRVVESRRDRRFIILDDDDNLVTVDGYRYYRNGRRRYYRYSPIPAEPHTGEIIDPDYDVNRPATYKEDLEAFKKHLQFSSVPETTEEQKEALKRSHKEFERKARKAGIDIEVDD